VDFETLAIHAGQEPDPTTGAVITPIYLTSTYAQESPGKNKGFEYSRTGNPTRKVLEANLAALEGGKFGLAFNSGCAATTTVASLLKAGDHLICSDDGYGGTFRYFDKILKTHGVEVSFIDLTSEAKLRETIKSNTKMIWLETPTNPMLKLVDIAMCVKAANEKKILVAVDNTFMSPYFQKPLKFGAHIVVHSTTKYLNGHSDVVGGAVVVNDQTLRDQLHFLQNSMGTSQSTFDSYLVLRSTKTLAVRMRAHQENAMKIAEFLQNHSQVERVIYPGLKSHPQHQLALKQMTGFGGMITFIIKGGLSSSRKFLEKVKIFALAESLGGVESLIEHPAIMTHASVPAEQRKALGIEDGLIRMSVGIESVNDLLKDLESAF
jgi:cystathionine gamma-lyase